MRRSRIPTATSGRPIAPTPRELATGAVPREHRAAVAGTADATQPEEAQLKPSRRERLRGIVTELDPREVTRGYSARPAIVVALVSFAWALQSGASAFLFPEVQRLHVNVVFMGGLLSLASLGFNFGGPGIGYLADRFRARMHIIRAGVMVRSLGVLGSGFASQPVSFIGANIVGTFGYLAANPVTQSVMADYYPTSVRVRQGFFNIKVAQLGTVIAPMMAALVAITLGWQWTLVLVGFFGLLTTVLTFTLREPVAGAMDRVEAGMVEDVTEIRTPRLGEALRTLAAIRTLRRIWLAYPFLAATYYMIPFSGIYFAQGWGLGPVVRGYIISGAAAAGALGAMAFTPMYRAFAEYRPARLLSLAAVLLVVEAGLTLLVTTAPVLPLAIAGYVAVGFLVPTIQQSVGSMLVIVVPGRVRTLGLESVGFLTLVAVLYTAVIGPRAATALLSFIGVSVGPAAGTLTAFIPAMLAGGFFIARASRAVDADIRSAQAVAVADAVVRQSQATGGDTLLVCRGVEVEVDGARILNGIDCDVRSGEIVALLGTNGAGKSTLLRAICGLHSAAGGAIFYDGVDITHNTSHQIAERGVVMLPGGHAVFPDMTVAENLRIAGWLGRHDDDAVVTQVRDDVLDHFPILRERLATTAGSMSGGEQQMLALAQALLMRPRLLMIDELSLGLAAPVVERLLAIIRAINEAGTTVLLVEQSVNVATAIATRVIFMDHGEVRFDGATEQLMEHRELMHSIFLGTPAGPAPTRARRLAGGEPTEIALQVHGARLEFGGVVALDGVDLAVQRGEVVGLVGPNGAGKTTLFDAVSGFVRLDSGSVEIAGNDVTRKSTDARARLGLGRSFQNVRLFPALTVRENIAVALDRLGGSRSTLASAFWLPVQGERERRTQRRIDNLIETLGLERYAGSFITELSTGTRRVVDIACVLASGPGVLLLDEPSSGLAQAEVEELGPTIRRISSELGCAVLVTEHDLGLVGSLADRIIVLRLGSVFAEGTPAAVFSRPDVSEVLVGGAQTALHRSGDHSAVSQLLEVVTQ